MGTKVEIKNLNSVRYIKKAIDHESEVLIQKQQQGEIILQQTKGFDEKTSSTYVIRTKENEDDYRYFPEPDLPPFIISDEEIYAIKTSMPPLQTQVQQNLISHYGLTAYSAAQIADDPELAELFLQIANTTSNYKAVANWITGPIKNYLAEETSTNNIDASSIAELIELIDKGIITYGIASQKIFPAIIALPGISVTTYIEQTGLQIQSTGETDAHIAAALTKYAEKITEYKKGKKGLLSLFVGEVMKLSKGKANAEEVTKKIMDKLN